MSEPKLDWPKSLIATHSGLRGRPGVDLTPAVVHRVIGSFATTLSRRGVPAVIAVARDERPASRALAAAVVDVASRLGLDIVDLGEVSTPTAKLFARLHRLGGAAVVTGSHLGLEWNGVKLVAAPGYLPVDIRDLVELPQPSESVPGRIRRDSSAARAHADALCSSIDVELIRSASLAAWARGGVGSLHELVLARLGIRHSQRGAVGFQLDADGDRLRLVDESGDTLDPEVVLPLVATARNARRVVRSADTSRMVDDIVAAAGGSVCVVPPGELNLMREVVRVGGDLAGEGNGGIAVPEVGRARDGLAGAVAVLELLARRRRLLRELVAELPKFVRLRSTISCGNSGGEEALTRLALAFGLPVPDEPEVGIQIAGEGDVWGLVRRSATEPVIRVTVEARHPAAADALHRELMAALRLQAQLV